MSRAFDTLAVRKICGAVRTDPLHFSFWHFLGAKTGQEELTLYRRATSCQ